MDFDSLPILLAEDNEDDVFIFQRACKQAAIPNPIHVAVDGEEVSDYLAGVGTFANRRRHPLPFLLLLDLKLPLRTGLEILESMRTPPALAKTIVVVLTSSAEQRDLAGARKLGARFYLVKPPKAKTLADMMDVLRREVGGTGAREAVKLDGDLFEAVLLGASSRRAGP